MTTTLALRPATLADAGALSALAREAYGKYVAIIRAIPMPMDADYSALIASETVLVLDGQEGPDASLRWC